MRDEIHQKYHHNHSTAVVVVVLMVLFMALLRHHRNELQAGPCGTLTSRRCHGGCGEKVAWGDGDAHKHDSCTCLVSVLNAADYCDDLEVEDVWGGNLECVLDMRRAGGGGGGCGG